MVALITFANYGTELLKISDYMHITSITTIRLILI